MEYKDYYKILGVDEKASASEIKRAYRKLAKEYHPDLHPDDEELTNKFKDINEAYEVLGDEEKRKKYDTFGSNYDFTGGQNFDPSDFGFGSNGTYSYQTGSSGNSADRVHLLAISLGDLPILAVRTVAIPFPQPDNQADLDMIPVWISP